MMKAIGIGMAGVLALAATVHGGEASISIDAGKVVGRIDEKIYGHFLEHIFHSVNGGLWGEMVWGRSFERGPGGGNWLVEDGCLVQKDLGENVRLLLGDTKWGDYEFTLEARKDRGAEGFLVIFRAAGEDDFYWYNLGGWGNRTHALERGVKGQGRWGRVGQPRAGQIETGRWYRIRARCEGPRLQVFLDDEQVLDFTDSTHPHLRGRVGVGTWRTSARYRKLKVASLDGKVLHEGLPKVVSSPSVARGWTTYGEGRFRWSSDDPLNCEHCQMVCPAGGEAGLQQAPFCIRKGETYHGSLWARGRADGLIVRLLDGPKPIASA
ncbi:MAG: family 16 glycoside hydrolase, partial [Phycisphaerae bacterium]